ncbi:hypothetical protein [Isoptericola sp. NPDC019482]|uniref:hypothetical protein n=1 Tax=Isoptericola sp. NPDC019482 TaxID=3154688 RepID=UPI003470AA56
MRRAPVGSAALLIALLLAGCASPEEPVAAPSAATGAASSQPPAAAPSRAAEATPDPSGLVDEDTGETIKPQAVPEWDAASRSSVVDAAAVALRAFARPGLDSESWWAELQPLLTQQAAEDYAYVDPANIPVQKVTGAGKLVDKSSAYVGTVEVPTDVGAYTLILTRKSADAEWKVSRITPPEGVN